MIRTLSLLAALLLPSMLQAQRSTQPPAIDPGMTRAQVVERFGAPFLTKAGRDSVTYLFYSNGREARVGMHDLVVLRGDVVVDAILRSPRRRFTGTSSSPVALSAQAAARSRPTTP